VEAGRDATKAAAVRCTRSRPENSKHPQGALYVGKDRIGVHQVRRGAPAPLEANMIAQEFKDGESRHGRQMARLASRLEKSLSMYAAAAAAAGVSFLSLAPCADARIVYTSASTNIPVNEGWVPIDLNHDGIADFSFSNQACSGSEGDFRTFLIARADNQGNAIWGRGSIGRNQRKHGSLSNCGTYVGAFASALRPERTVRANKTYFQKGTNRWLMALTQGSIGRPSVYSYGQWLYAKGRYLGLRFTVSGQTHYGWARLTTTLLTGNPGIQATITGYAYETIPNKPIITGKTKGPDVITLEPASLGHLAQGASGIPAWRKSGGRWKSAAH
jgi:hypothetical protein